MKVTLTEYIKRLQRIHKAYGDLELIYAQDDEGNGYDTVHFFPSVGYFDGSDEFRIIDDDDDDDNDDEYPINAICMN